MHMSWMRLVGGRLKSSYRYSAGLVYNTFPIPQFSASKNNNIEKYADQVLKIRSKYPKSTLSELYNQRTMPPDLRDAHRNLDLAVDKLYRKKKNLHRNVSVANTC